jgi:hypothetical protein
MSLVFVKAWINGRSSWLESGNDGGKNERRGIWRNRRVKNVK